MQVWEKGARLGHIPRVQNLIEGAGMFFRTVSSCARNKFLCAFVTSVPEIRGKNVRYDQHFNSSLARLRVGYDKNPGANLSFACSSVSYIFILHVHLTRASTIKINRMYDAEASHKLCELRHSLFVASF